MGEGSVVSWMTLYILRGVCAGVCAPRYLKRSLICTPPCLVSGLLFYFSFCSMGVPLCGHPPARDPI